MTFLLPFPSTRKGWQHVCLMRMSNAKSLTYFKGRPVGTNMHIVYVLSSRWSTLLVRHVIEFMSRQLDNGEEEE